MLESFNTVIKTLCAVKYAMGCAKVLCQSWGFNGLKRKYRLYGTCLHYYIEQIECEMFDNHDLVASRATESYPAYTPASIEAHLDAWQQLMVNAVHKLTEANKVLVPAIGKQNCYVERALSLLYREKCKSLRWYRRYKSGTGLHDLHIMDDMLHKKMKKCEKKELPEWI